MNKENLVKALVLINLILIIFYIGTINKRYTLVDEAIIGEHAYWLQEIGVVKSHMISGLDIKWEERAYHYHKLFVLAGATVTKLFGFSLINLRLISIFFSLFLFWLMWRLIVVKKEYEGGKILFLMVTLIFLFNGLFFEWSYVYRPEVMVTALGFASFYQLQKFLKNNNNSTLIIAAVFAGLAALTHLNGIAFIAAGFLFLFIYKYYLRSVVFGVIATFVLGFYFIDLLTPESFQGFLVQFTNDPNLEKADFNIFTPFIKILSEHSRLFHSPKESIFSALLIAVLLFNFRYLNKNYKGLLIYALLAIISLAGIAHGPTTKYALLYFPYLVIIVGIGLYRISQINRSGKLIISFLLMAYIGYHSYYTFSIRLNNSVKYQQRNELINKLTDDSKSPKIAHGSYVFNELGKNKIINSLMIIPYTKEFMNGMETKKLIFDDYALRSNNRFVVIDKLTEPQYIVSDIGFDLLQKGDTIYHYTVKHKVDDLIVFEKTDWAN